MLNAILRFIGSKWFMLILMIGMGLVIPITWGNLQVVIEKGALSSYWWVAAVFICNVLALVMAFWKFMSSFSSGKQNNTVQQTSW